MTFRDDSDQVVREISVLYELALAVGQTLDLEENCDRFLKALMARKDLAYASVWIKQAYLADRPEKGAAGGPAILVYAHPRFRVREEKLPLSHAIFSMLEGKGAFSLGSSEELFREIITEKRIQEGAFAVFALGELGVLKLFAMKRTIPFSETELNPLRNVIAKFAVSLEACIAHRQMVQEISERKRAEEALRESEEKFRKITASAQDAIIMMDDEGNLSYWNEAAEKIFGYSSEEALGKEMHVLLAPQRYYASFKEAFEKFKTTGGGPIVGRTRELPGLRKDGSEFPGELSISAVKLKNRWHAIGIIRDITERKRAEGELKRLNENLENLVAKRTQEIRRAYDELKQTQAQLLQSEKMASIGQLAAGVAHEINNPMGFIQSNLGTLSEYAQDLMDLLERYTSLEEQVEEGDAEQAQAAMQEIQAQKEKMDVGFILEDLTSLIAESQEGAERVRKIVQDLKEFSHVDQAEKKAFNVNDGLKSTLNIVWNELKYKATVEVDYGELPEIVGYPMQLNQVFMNILVNAGQAIEEQGEIGIRTYEEDGCVCVAISDTGRGMPPEVQGRIFDPFFTMKGVGKGTGLGLSMSYNIVKKHGGDIRVDSQEGEGATFTVRIPVERR